MNFKSKMYLFIYRAPHKRRIASKKVYRRIATNKLQNVIYTTYLKPYRTYTK